jgi:hypothetical protein
MYLDIQMTELQWQIAAVYYRVIQKDLLCLTLMEVHS